EFENGSYIQTALLDGVPGNLENPYGTQIILNKNDGLLVINEMGIVNSEEEQLKSKIAFGGWIYTAKSEVNNLNIFSLSPNYQNNYGFYFTAESAFYSPHENSNLGLNGFVRIGYANPQVNPVDFYLGTGFKFSGLFGTDNNELGLAIAFSHNSQGFRNIAELNGELIKPYEINLEATFLMPLTPYLIIQPDIQYIINPSYCTNSNSAFVISSRIQLHF
ncbi:MAG: carbohydrate porin, partial [Ignavibacteria bacterium]|nr:carbohydrate porin [Ignavibacteria bacterium]